MPCTRLNSKNITNNKIRSTWPLFSWKLIISEKRGRKGMAEGTNLNLFVHMQIIFIQYNWNLGPIAMV